MNGGIAGFIIWALCGLLFAGFGIYALFLKKPMGFWAGAEVFEVTDVKKYNRAVAKLFFAYGAVFMLLGLPLLTDNAALMLVVSMPGVMAETIAMMVIYTVVIERKYKKK